VTANGFRVEGWKPLDTDKPAVVQDPDGKQWWIFFPKRTFRHNPDAEHKWGPYPTERKAAETLVGVRYQLRIHEIRAELDAAVRKRDRVIVLLIFLVILLCCSTLAALLHSLFR
jgi:hypothetical protein